MRHKRPLRLLSLICALSVPLEARAQFTDTPLPPTRLGLTAGVNLAKLAAPNLENVSNRDGFVGGASLVTPFAPNMAFQIEALYSMKGAVQTTTPPAPASKTTYILNYIEIPVMLRGDVQLLRTVRPFVYTGPALGIRIGCGLKNVAPTGTTSATCDELSGQEFNRFDIGWMLGGGLSFDAGGRTISLAARYEHGFRNITTDNQIRNRVLSFMASVEAPLPMQSVR
jgi:hypothetical protein